METKVPRIGVCAVIKHNNSVLLGYRTGSHSPNVWACPGGHLEYGEHPIEAAIRETKEETNLDIEPADDWDLGWTSNVYDSEGKHYVTIFIRCVLTDRCWSTDLCTMEPDKFREWKWFDMNEIPNDLMNNTTLAMLRGA